MVDEALTRLDLDELADRPPRHAVGRRAPAGRPRPRARPGGDAPLPRRADDRARHRPPAGDPRAGRRPAAPARASPSCRRCTTSPSPRSTPTTSCCWPRARRAVGPAVQVLTGAQLEHHYGARVDVIRHRGNLVVVPWRDDPHQEVTHHDRARTRATSPPTTRGPTTCGGRRRSCSSTPATARARRPPPSASSCAASGGAGRSAVVQFLKSGTWKTGEEKVCRQLGVDWWAMGEGFTWDSEDLTLDQAVAAGRVGPRQGADRGGRPPARRARRGHLPDQLGLDRRRRRAGHDPRPPVARQRRVHRPQRPRGARSSWPTPSPTWASASTPTSRASGPRRASTTDAHAGARRGPLGQVDGRRALAARQ